MSSRRIPLFLATVLAASLLAAPVAATTDSDAEVTKTDNVEQVAHIPYIGGSEVDYDGERYLFAGQANLDESLSRQTVSPKQHGGLRIIDLEGDADTEQFSVVGELNCPGTDNYVRYMDPEVFNTDAGDREFVAVAHHGNYCTSKLLRRDPNTTSGYGAFNGVMIVDVTDKTNPTIASAIGHYSAHTVMPHPTKPYLYVLPGGTTNGTSGADRVSPTGIIDVSDPYQPKYVNAFQHNAVGCHDLGFSHDGDYAFCAGLQEVQVWDIAGDKVENPEVIGYIHNPAIMFAHNVVVSPDSKYIAINDEAFGFHTCTGEAADLYGSLWIYDITDPATPLLAGRISPPGHPDGQTAVGAYDDAGPVNGWADSWCAAHNYNWVPGTDIIVASWFAGGITAHDISDPMNPQKLVHYMPDDGVAWSGHYYGGYMVTNDMVRGLEILDAPVLREAEQAAAATQAVAGEEAIRPRVAAPRMDLTSVLVPKVLPPRPEVRRDVNRESGICVLPGSPFRQT